MSRPLQSPRAPRYDIDLACQQLAAADPKLGKLIARAGPFTLRVASAQSPFQALVESIVYQQLHGKAAATIHRRLLESFHPLCGLGNHPDPQHLLDCPNEQLRAAGLSHNKALAIQSRLIERYGGLPGIRDAGALESAVARTANLVSYGGIDSVPELGAALAWAILRNHPFADGNKRAAFAGLLLFLDLNGCRLTCSKVEETAMVLRAAASAIAEDEWAAWVVRSVEVI